jgi:SAM-dependent methyltransferase
MSIRVSLGNFLIRLGRFIQSLALMVMRPDDLLAFNRRTYVTSAQLAYFGSGERLAQGLNPLEESLVANIPVRQGRLLLLGVGGGREAIPLARLGFEVTGVDFVPEMVQAAKNNAAAQGLNLEALVQEISRLEVPPGSFQVVWLSGFMYSSFPTRTRRVEMLRRIRQALSPGGYFVCSFTYEVREDFSPKVERARKLFAWLTRGYLAYEPGDLLWQNLEFMHAFASDSELRTEFTQGGFGVLQLHLPAPASELTEGWALLERN